MAKKFLVFITLAVLVNVIVTEEAEQKKRGAAKTTSLNAIPTGSQKPDYTYSIYQNPSTQSTQQSTAYTPVSNSFYPSQTANQYYTNQPNDASIYPSQPQISLLPPSPPQSQFLPLNFVPNPGYQSKYQIVPSKQGNIQLAFIQPSPIQGSVLQIPQHVYNPGSVNPQVFPGNGAQNFQPYQIGGNYLGHPQQIFFAQPNQALYNNNLLYPNPLQSFYNYYPSNAQTKYNIAYGSQPISGQEYDKIQSGIGLPGPISQVKPEDNDLAVHSTEYVPSSDISYKSYSASRGPTYQTKQ